MSGQHQHTEHQKSNYYASATRGMRAELGTAIPHDLLRSLHVVQPAKHFLVVAWQFLLLFGGMTAIYFLEPWYFWVPVAIVVGFTIFNFTILVHEAVHDCVLSKKGRPLNEFLGQIYAFPSGISYSQFRQWHLDHHAELGHDEDDPKRHHLSPKRNARWYKLLYMTPALFFIYFRAAKRETGTYPVAQQRRARIERVLTIGGHLAILAALWFFLGGMAAFKMYVVPYFIVFPVAFTLNRLGQHYNIDPSDPAKWSTLMGPSRFWEVAFLWSSYHLEHHYFPRVPFYNLRRLHFALRPFFKAHGLRPTNYRSLLWHWFVLNREPHTDWSVPDVHGGGGEAEVGSVS